MTSRVSCPLRKHTSLAVRPSDFWKRFTTGSGPSGQNSCADSRSKYSSIVIADLRVLVDRRELLVDFAWRELRARYKGSALGFLWNFVNPLLQLVVFWILFGVVLRTRPITASGEQPYAIFLFVGLLDRKSTRLNSSH